MRDILTVLAVLLILVLTAAVAAPPFIAWEAHREAVDRGIARAAGAPAETQGAIAIRLLPTPRIRLEGLRLGTADGPALAATNLASEIDLGALMRGEVRFLQGEAERAEIRVPLSPDGRLRLPAVSGETLAGRVAFEDVAIGQLLVTGLAPETGRTEQLRADAVRVTGASLAGPWRVEGRTGGFPFRVVSGLPGRDGAAPVRVTGGGGDNPRLELDLRLALDRTADGVAPVVSGTGRLAAGPPAQDPAVQPLPVTAQAEIRGSGRAVDLENLAIDLGEGAGSVRLTGSGRLETGEPGLALRLEARRLDLDALLATPNGAALRERASALAASGRLPVSLDLSLGSLAVAGEEVTAFRLAGRAASDGLRLTRLDATAPGQTAVALQAAGDGAGGGFNGQARVASRASDRFAAFLARIGVESPLLSLLAGPPFEAEAAVAVSPPLLSFRNLRVEAGGATLTGALRYTAAEGGARPRLDAQIATQGLDLADLPRLDRAVSLGEGVDLGLTLQARDVRYAGAGAGRVVARLVSEGATLRVEELQVEDLAGADARVSGRLLPDGSGRVEGQVRARRAAPLIDGLAVLVPDAPLGLLPLFIREGALDLALAAERAAPAPGAAPGLRTTLKGTVAGGPFQAEIQAAEGATQALSVQLQTADTARWLGQANPLVSGRPSALSLRGTRAGPGRLAVTAEGDLAGLRVATTRPFAFLQREGILDAGEATLATGDLRPVLHLLGGAAGPAPVPADLRLTLSRAGPAATLQAGGRLAGEPVQARLTGTSLRDLSGEASLGSLSLPWLAEGFALGALPASAPGALWSSASFAEPRRPGLEGTLALRVARLDLGRGLEARDARLTLAATRDGVAFRDLSASLAGGQVAGSVTLGRAGARVSVSVEGSLADVAISDLVGPGAPGGRLTANVQLGGAGETPAAVIANLAGEGRVGLNRLELPSAAPGAVRRTLERTLAESDPLNARRLADALDAELARGPLVTREATASATLVSGVVRINPLALPVEAGSWSGSLALDLRNLGVEMRGLLSAGEGPKGWAGPPPAVVVGWRGPVRALRRDADAGPLTNGLAAIVLQRELERIELFEMEASERARFQGRLTLERQRREDARRAAEEAARRAQEEAARRAIEERRAAEEAARQARLRAQAEAEAERRRAAEEAQRKAAEEAAALRRLIEESQRTPSPPPP